MGRRGLWLSDELWAEIEQASGEEDPQDVAREVLAAWARRKARRSTPANVTPVEVEERYMNWRATSDAVKPDTRERLDAVMKAAGGWFRSWPQRYIAKHVVRELHELVRDFPDIAEWRRLGEWMNKNSGANGTRWLKQGAPGPESFVNLCRSWFYNAEMFAEQRESARETQRQLAPRPAEAPRSVMRFKKEEHEWWEGRTQKEILAIVMGPRWAREQGIPYYGKEKEE
jgi:hypothetical protein